MRVDICHIRNGNKSFSLASLFVSRMCFCVRVCLYYRAEYDSGFGLFYWEIGRFAERRGQFGTRIRFLWWEGVWYKKVVNYGS